MITISSDELPGSPLSFEKRRIRLGSDPKNDVVIKDASVQGFHAQILDGNGIKILSPSGARVEVDGRTIIAETVSLPCEVTVGNVLLQLSAGGIPVVSAKQEDVRVQSAVPPELPAVDEAPPGEDAATQVSQQNTPMSQAPSNKQSGGGRKLIVGVVVILAILTGVGTIIDDGDETPDASAASSSELVEAQPKPEKSVEISNPPADPAKASSPPAIGKHSVIGEKTRDGIGIKDPTAAQKTNLDEWNSKLNRKGTKPQIISEIPEFFRGGWHPNPRDRTWGQILDQEGDALKGIWLEASCINVYEGSLAFSKVELLEEGKVIRVGGRWFYEGCEGDYEELFFRISPDGKVLKNKDGTSYYRTAKVERRLKDQLHTKKSVPVPEVQEFLEPWEQEKKPEPKVEPKVTRKPAPPRNSSPSKSAGKPTRTRVPWKVKEYRNSKYVPLSQVKDFYGFTSMTKSGGYIILRNSEVELKFRAGGQEVLMNNVKFIFSHAVVSLGTYHISIVDLSKVIDPVLRPFEIKEAKEFDTVIIDPGHGGKDAGAVNSLGTEAGYNLKVAKLLQENLKKRGFKVIMTRTTNVFLTLQERVELANRHKDAIFISIHFNSAGSGDSSQDRGIETFTLSPVGVAHYGRGLKASDNIERMGNAQDSANTALATAIHWRSIQALAKAKLEVPDRGIRRARYSVLTGVKHPAIHFVGGFMSHPKEKYLINNPTYQRTLAESMCEAIVFYRKATMQKIGPAKR